MSARHEGTRAGGRRGESAKVGILTSALINPPLHRTVEEVVRVERFGEGLLGESARGEPFDHPLPHELVQVEGRLGQSARGGGGVGRRCVCGVGPRERVG